MISTVVSWMLLGLHAIAPVYSTSAQFGTLQAQSGVYTVQANEWNSTLPQTVTSTGGAQFAVSQANFHNMLGGPPASYPSIYRGCHWGACTKYNPFPRQVSGIKSLTSSWSTTQVTSNPSVFDVSYDLWFNSTSTTNGQPNGTELMIWLNNSPGVQPYGNKVNYASVSGRNYNVYQGNEGWNVISYQDTGVTSVSNFNLLAFLRDAQVRKMLNPSHYLISVEAGFEIWQGGQGLATNSFRVDVS